MKELLSHLDEFNTHIKNFDDEIDNHIALEKKHAVEVVKGAAQRTKNQFISEKN